MYQSHRSCWLWRFQVLLVFIIHHFVPFCTRPIHILPRDTAIVHLQTSWYPRCSLTVGINDWRTSIGTVVLHDVDSPSALKFFTIRHNNDGRAGVHIVIVLIFRSPRYTFTVGLDKMRRIGIRVVVNCELLSSRKFFTGGGHDIRWRIRRIEVSTDAVSSASFRFYVLARSMSFRFWDWCPPTFSSFCVILQVDSSTCSRPIRHEWLFFVYILTV